MCNMCRKGASVKVLTRSEALACQKLYEQRWQEHEDKRKSEGRPASIADYYAHKGIWAGAFGAEQVQVVDDPVEQPATSRFNCDAC